MIKIRYKLVIFYIFTLFMLLFSSLNAQTRRAFLVGINEYSPQKVSSSPCRKKYSNLSGCINDVEAMAAIFESKFDFKQENIHTLINEKATRNNIINKLNRYLVIEANPGDICVFYFSGHGSQVRNSKSSEYDGYDETLVPADSYKGAQDIRDKELKKIFNSILNKKIQLIAIIDSCHSGSISRGIPFPIKFKALEPNDCDVADPPDKDESPAKKGALIFNASQDFERAIEFIDEDENAHGLFTWALLNVLRNVSIEESAQNIILRVNALMHSEGQYQEPNLEGLQEQRMKSLFGFKPGTHSKVTATVINIKNEDIILQGGIAAGIRENCEFRHISEKEKNSEIQLKIIKTEGINRSKAKLIFGDITKIQKGDLYEMVRWGAFPETELKLWIPMSNFSHEMLIHIALKIKETCNINGIVWITDPTEINPSFTITWNNSEWILNTPTQIQINLGKTPNLSELNRQLHLNHSNKKQSLFLQLPLSSEFSSFIKNEMVEYNTLIKILSSPVESHYILGGRLNEKKIEYAWILPNMMKIKNQSFPLPVRTDWTLLDKTVSYSDTLFKIKERILQIAYIRAWMQLSSPPDTGMFPYRLALKNAETFELKTAGPLIEGEKYDLILFKKETNITYEIEKRYIYVFVIDSYGKGTLLFPLSEVLNSENCFPIQENLPPSLIELSKGGLFDVTSPFGIDTFILLTSAEPISNPDVLNFNGVRRGKVKGQLSPLEKLLWGVGLTRSKNLHITHTGWSIERLSIQTKKNRGEVYGKI